MYVCMYLCMYVYIYVCMYVCMYVCLYICMYVCMYVYMYVCAYMYMHVCMYVCDDYSVGDGQLHVLGQLWGSSVAVQWQFGGSSMVIFVIFDAQSVLQRIIIFRIFRPVTLY